MAPEIITALLPPQVSEGVRERVEQTLVHLIKQNRHTRFVSESPIFDEFRGALGALGDSDADESLLECFRTTIPLTGYDSYEPFVNKLVVANPSVDAVKDVFCPGIPYFIARSSATSGKKVKLFAKYLHESRSSLHEVDEHANPVSSRGGKNCIVYSLACHDVVNVVGEEGNTVAQVPITMMSSGVVRMKNGLSVDKDPWAINYIAPRATSPIAASFVADYRSFLLTHALFALAEPGLETINTLFGTVFIDMMRYMEEEWELLVQSIETGVLPDWEGISHVRQYLEPKFSAKPERVAHLRAVGKATEQPGWLRKLWPGLSVVIGIVSGVFSSAIPKMQHYLGPDVRMSSLGFTASEAYIGTAFSHSDLSLFKATSDEVIEYLEVSKAETPSSLVFAHEVEVGRRYEIVLTTRDGLWRYRLGDIAEIAGFDPNDGSPILRYVERRGTFLRVHTALISEKELANAIFSVQDVLGSITEFTVIRDERRVPCSLAFLVEIDSTPSNSARGAPARIEADLCRSNGNYEDMVNARRVAPPTVQVLKPGTFREYRALKIKDSATGAGQIKVPAVLWDPEVQDWMLQRVESVVASD